MYQIFYNLYLQKIHHNPQIYISLIWGLIFSEDHLEHEHMLDIQTPIENLNQVLNMFKPHRVSFYSKKMWKIFFDNKQL